MDDSDFVRKSLFMTGGLLIWAAHFTVVYAFNSLACARGFTGMEVLGFGIVPVVVVAATILAAAATLAILLLAWMRRGPARSARDDRPVDGFMRYTTITITGLSLVAITWNGLPALMVLPCA